MRQPPLNIILSVAVGIRMGLTKSHRVPWDRLRCEVYYGALTSTVSMERPDGV